jgi:hypothetical protein
MPGQAHGFQAKEEKKEGGISRVAYRAKETKFPKEAAKSGSRCIQICKVLWIKCKIYLTICKSTFTFVFTNIY